MRSLIISLDMDVLTKKLVILISVPKHYLNGFIFSKRRACDFVRERTVRGSQNIVRNDSPVGSSWLVNCLEQGSLRISLAFLNLIVLSLCYARNYKELFYKSYITLGKVTSIRILRVFLSSSHGANLYRNYRTLLLYKSSVAFFITTALPSVLWLSRSTKKGQNFNLQTVIGSGKAISAQNVAGVWGVCWPGAHLFHSKH